MKTQDQGIRQVKVKTGRGAIQVSLPVGAALLGLGLAPGIADAADHTVTNLSDAGPGSFRAALEAADSNPGADRILFQSGLSGTVNLASDLPAVDGSVEILGPGASTLTIDGGGTHHMLEIEGTSTVSGLTLARAKNDVECYTYEGDPPYEGPYEYCYSMSGSALRINSGATVAVKDMAFTENQIERDSGAAISAGSNSTSLTISDSSFTGNESSGTGGAVVAGGPTTITGSTFTGNRAAWDGGAVNFYGYGGGPVGGLTLSGSTFTGNEAGGGGGAVYASAQRLVDVEQSTFSGNQAGWTGGGLTVGPGSRPAKVTGNTLVGNSATGYGGYYSYGGSGGGLTIGPGVTAEVSNSTLTANKSENGPGGAISSWSPSVTFDSLTVVGNTATGSAAEGIGGGLFQTSQSSTLRNSIVSGNIATVSPDIGGNPEYTSYYSGTIPAATVSTSFSLIGNTAGTAFKDAVPGSNLIGLDPKLGALAENGGATRTMLPAAGSPVINKGASSLTTDQRGSTRPIDYYGVPFSPAPGANGADIGAVELPSPPVPVAAKLTFGKVTYNKKKGTATAVVKLNTAGSLAVSGKTVAGVKKTVKAAGQLKVVIKAKGKAAKKLKKKGKVSVKATFTFKAEGGTEAKNKTFKLAKKKPKKKKKKK